MLAFWLIKSTENYIKIEVILEIGGAGEEQEEREGNGE
jgi:hypothetical protein